MSINIQLAKHFRDHHFGGNWATSSLQENLKDITWQQAITKKDSFNSIAELVFHMNYFVSAVLQVLQGGALDAKDIYSFDLPPITSQEEWEKLLDKTWNDAENFAIEVEKLDDSKFWEDFIDPKYGNYFRNINGIIEHNHYHLGQIVILKKLL